jgi:putative transposase
MRTYRRLQVRLSKGDRDKLHEILRGGVQAVRTVLRALALCRLDEGRSASQVAAEVRLTSKAVREIGRRYEDGGLEPALYERPRPGAAAVLDDRQKQRIKPTSKESSWWAIRISFHQSVREDLLPISPVSFVSALRVNRQR